MLRQLADLAAAIAITMVIAMATAPWPSCGPCSK